MPLKETVARNVRAEVARHGANITQMAEQLSISKQSASQKWRGNVPYSFDELDLLAGWLEVSPETFVRLEHLSAAA
ncbi:helix-turn-helix domain-containing protein [Rothia nasimurium]|uniref:helix-turn-helix domain-containing protein n=1 Tax=Rothia nasimurium TaxID=85336 RepID=UPI001F166C21|nr:helix-turn-helix domain-containing protein [Rothia nasimurium]